ncbi:hypothetical protein GpartN1_g1970.t1 [Galdieria partita]|uniref:Uncharacterized protein n=1 Tax=Galdieria partita TaxID=83374 RepID=A0A9C7UNT0_9RHOD|nr:hypothetical protein GpartN1_g1970.t1 [Galdieria partita]
MYSSTCFLSICTFTPRRQLLSNSFIHTSPRVLFGCTVYDLKLKHRCDTGRWIRAQQQTEDKRDEETKQLSDYEFAERCVDGGCPVEDVQELLVRLEDRRKLLQKEIERISDLMAKLAKYNTAEDRGLLRDVVLAALSIFSRSESNYPEVGESPWSMDPYRPKKWED